MRTVQCARLSRTDLALEVLKTIYELKEVLVRAWDLIPQKTIPRLCASFEARLHICFEMEGDSISQY
jgi:hypothetical protein